MGVLKTWLTCMSDYAPIGIITDQDKAMKIVPEKLRSFKSPYLSLKGLHVDM